MKCLISIDVGIKNLAICVLKKDRDIISIVHWGVYDMIQEVKKKKEPTDGICTSKIKSTGKICGKKGRTPLGGKRAYCGTHEKKKKDNMAQDWCWELIKKLPDVSTEIKNKINSECPDEIQVVIEQQPLENKKIMLISHVIFAHFIEIYENKVPVSFVPAYNKLLVYDGPEITCLLKTPYAKRKFLAKEYTKWYLEQECFKEWQQFFVENKVKADDKADSFLQGMYVFLGKSSTCNGEEINRNTGKRKKKLKFHK